MVEVAPEPRLILLENPCFCSIHTAFSLRLSNLSSPASENNSETFLARESLNEIWHAFASLTFYICDTLSRIKRNAKIQDQIFTEWIILEGLCLNTLKLTMKYLSLFVPFQTVWEQWHNRASLPKLQVL